MISLDSIYDADAANFEYFNTTPINIYDSSECKALATQAIAHRHLRLDAARQNKLVDTAVPVLLIEDQYPGWLDANDLKHLCVTDQPYQAIPMERDQIASRLPNIIAYAKQAMTLTNEYLWGGTIGPNLDCSGLVQRSFGSEGIWLPRDAYQQEAFVKPISISLEAPSALDTQLQAGDLIFFGTPTKATHVALYLSQGQYIHSSGKDQGRNGIGVDSLIDLTHPVSQNYAQQLRGAGRVIQSYCP